MSLEFTEYGFAKSVYGALPAMDPGPAVATQVVAIGVGSVQSAAFNDRTRVIAISKIDADCRIAVGTNPTAVAGAGGSRFLKTGNEYRFAVEAGQKLAVINA